ncbi:MAG: monovalent cation/H(+) antiporter subunit G [Desulfuromonadales bacterium]|nr:monovalent cation/H(+) antiporter subunit G [Desulfuromonadales bacterium]
MIDAAVALLLTIGTLFAAIAAIGILRMPDFYMRISATSKASTLGVTFILGATALYFHNAAVSGKIIAIIAFIILTTPVAAHMIGRAAHRSGVPLWNESIRDDLSAADPEPLPTAAERKES